MIGQTISHYRILEKLGEGGMGVVYKAQDTKLNRPVALKVLPRQALITEEDKSRFAREAQAAASLSHPNVAMIFEFDEVDDPATGGKLAFIAMEYVDGETVKQKIKERPLPIDEAVKIAMAAAEGLTEAHQKGIVHRDIKSDNVMISRNGLVKIMDFGLAEIAGRSRVTKEGMTVGTAAYMSPEQALGEKLDPRTDIWSLGVVMYEMITGRLPFAGDYEQAIVYRILNEEPEPITSLRSNIPMELERIVKKAMQKDRSNRYQHVDEMLVDLKSLKRETESVSTKTVAAKRPTRRRSYVYGGVGVLVLILGLGVFYFYPREVKTIDSIAVLPLKNLMGDPEQEYFVEGMHEALITELAKISALKVISRTSTVRYKGTDKPLPQVARELGVAGVIEGSVLREGDLVRITVQLIHGSTDRHLWAKSFDRELRGVLALHSEVARAIADEIKAKLTPQEQERLVAARTVNPKAYELYLLGRHYENQRTVDGYKQAVQSFQKAIEQDPGYASAYAALADSYLWLGEQGGLPQKEARSLAEAALRKALELDANLAEVHSSLGLFKLNYEWNWREAEKEFKRAIELNPGDALAHQRYGRGLDFTGHYEEALQELERARELDPLSMPIRSYLGQVHLHARKYDRAAHELQKALELQPNHALVLHNLGELYIAQGRYVEAIAPLQKSSELSSSSHYLAMLGCAYARADRKPEATKILKELQQRLEQNLVSAFDMASLHMALGENERALSWLERGYQERDGWLVELKAWPWFDSLRSDPRFQNLLKKVGLEE